MSLEQIITNLEQRKIRLESEIEQICIEFQDSVPAELVQFNDLLKKLAFKDDIQDEVALERSLCLLRDTFNNLSSSLKNQFVEKRGAPEESDFNDYEDVGSDRQKLLEVNQKIAYCEIILGRVKLESAPQIVNIDPSLKCNYRCKTCHHSMSLKNKTGSLSESVLNKLDDLFKRIEVLQVFGGGEPTLSYALSKLAHKIKKFNIPAEILTNGSTLSKMKLPLSVFRRLGISFDGDNERTFQAIRYGSHFDRLIERIKRFRSEFPDVDIYFNMTLNKLNVDEIEGVLRLASDLGVNTLQLNKMHGYYPQIKDIELDQDDRGNLISAFEKARLLSKQYGMSLTVALDVEALPPRKHSKTKEELLVDLESFVVAVNENVLSVEDAIEETRMVLLSIAGSYELARGKPTSVSSPDTFTAELPELEQILVNLEQEVRNLELTGITLPTCLVPWVRSNIRSDGTVRPCAIMNDTMGCVESENGFKGVWNSKKYIDLRSSHVESLKKDLCETCKNCTYIEKDLKREEVVSYLETLKNK